MQSRVSFTVLIPYVGNYTHNITTAAIVAVFYSILRHIIGDRMRLQFTLPLAEVITDFYDKLKHMTSGYARFVVFF